MQAATAPALIVLVKWERQPWLLAREKPRPSWSFLHRDWGCRDRKETGPRIRVKLSSRPRWHKAVDRSSHLGPVR